MPSITKMAWPFFQSPAEACLPREGSSDCSDHPVYTETRYVSFSFCCPGSPLLRWAFSSCSERGLLFVAVPGLLVVVASLVVENGLKELKHMGSRAQAQ